MNSPNPTGGNGFVPSGSTVASGIGGAIATVVIYLIQAYTKQPVDGVLGGAIALICSTIAGYIPASGRK